MIISEHISYEEATVSPTALRLGIDNKPDAETLQRMIVVAGMVFEPLRKRYGKPIKINSFFRGSDLNKAVGGSATSQHVTGEAIDISGGSKFENRMLLEYIKEYLDFDQLINEYDFSWVHVSYKSTGNRKQVINIV